MEDLVLPRYKIALTMFCALAVPNNQVQARSLRSIATTTRSECSKSRSSIRYEGLPGLGLAGGGDLAVEAPQTGGHIAIPSVKRDWLLNGLQLMILPSAGTGAVTAHLRINSGAMFDLAGKGGLADITAGMLLRSARGVAAKELSELVTQLGLTINVSVGWDSTDIVISGAASGLESILDLLGRFVVSPAFGQPELDSLKAERIKELTAGKASATELARQTAVEALYGRYPLGRPVHGTADSISKITSSDVVYYHNRFYIANDAALVVQGDAIPEDVIKIARSKLGIWKKGEKVPATFLPPEPLSSRRIVIVDRPDSSDADVVSAGYGISRRSDDYLASAVMARLLELTLERSSGGGLASGISVRLEPRLLPGPLLVSFVSPRDKAALAVGSLLEAMERLRTGSTALEDLERAKQAVISSYARDTATVQGQISALLDIEEYGLGRDYLMNFEARVSAVSADEVKAAAQKHLNAGALAISVVGPAGTLSDPLKRFGQIFVAGGHQTF